MSTGVLIVEDDAEIRKILGDYLTARDFTVTCAEDGLKAQKVLESEKFDIVLMDMMLPFISGDKLIEKIREKEAGTKKTPVIVISARSKLDIRLEVLRMGADDYIIKPFDLEEVLVRMEVVLRRSLETTGKEGELKLGKLCFNSENNTVSYDQTQLKLTLKEMQLLKLFMDNPEKTFTKANLYESVWEDTYYCEDNTINVHISNLRNKLKKAAGKDIIETVWGIGYRLLNEGASEGK